MKLNRKKTAALLFVLFLSAGTGLAAKTEHVIGVHGLSCPFCAYGLEKKLKGLEGVESVSIDLNKGRAVITTDRPIEEKKIRKAVDDAGFSVSSLKTRTTESETKAKPGNSR